MRKRLLLVVLLVLICCFSCKKQEKDTFIKLQGNVYGTTYSITYEGEENYQKSMDSIYYLVNKSLSTYMPTSDIYRVNKNDSTVEIDEFFTEVFSKSKRIYKETDGYFDPTVGGLMKAYGFGNEKYKNLTDEELNRLMESVGFDKIDLIHGKIYKKNPNIELDVNSIAKGFGIDLVARMLDKKGVENYLVEIGGEIRAKGLKNGNPWKVAIEKPNFDNTRSLQRIIEVENKSMATSGNYRKFRIDSAGNKFVHILNPKTGLAKESNLLSASVIAEIDCADVDAYATAFMAMGLEKTKEFLKEHPNLKVILLYADKEGNIVEYEN